MPVFTSPEALVSRAFGDLIQAYHELDYPVLLQRWPDRDHQLAVNPGSPIAVYLPPHAVADLVEGRQSPVAVTEVQRVLTDEATAQLRWICLTELAGGSGATGETGLREDPPANRLNRPDGGGGAVGRRGVPARAARR